MSSSTTPVYDGSPEHKTKKYDRQLRLWGDHGQAALELAMVCLINANSTGTEILKNLILPGIGSFTIVDGNKVTGEDSGNNFFLDQDSIGKSRACVATEMLVELNDDVSGDYIEETVDNLLDGNPTFFNNFSVVIACQLPEKTLLRLAGELWDHDIPLLVCRSYGFIGYMRIVIKEHTSRSTLMIHNKLYQSMSTAEGPCRIWGRFGQLLTDRAEYGAVIESHPDSALEDLRLDHPFPALVEFCDSLNLETMSKKDHSHTPWLVIIYKFLHKWKEMHGDFPKNYKEKTQFKTLIRKGMRHNENGVPEDEENFDEAVTNVNTALVQSKVPNHIQRIFNDECCTNLHSESKPFWILARALKEFVNSEGQGLLPLRGSIPDMTADSERYIQLQNLYKVQASLDAGIVANTIQSLLQSLGRDEPLIVNQEVRSPGSSPGQPQDNISDTDIKKFCRNASFLQLLRCRSLTEEYDTSTAKTSDLAQHLEDLEEDDVVFYVMLRAVDRFHTKYNRYPGFDDGMETDVPALKACVNKLLHDWNLTQTVKDEFVHEFCRYGAAELHSVAAFIGGAAAQEVIKIVTSQFVPFNNTLIYNAMKQSTKTIEL